jgi:hypothetical protein
VLDFRRQRLLITAVYTGVDVLVDIFRGMAVGVRVLFI